MLIPKKDSRKTGGGIRWPSGSGLWLGLLSAAIVLAGALLLPGPGSSGLEAAPSSERVPAVVAPLRGKPTHMNRTLNPGGCGACHAGRGMSPSGLLKDSMVEVCYDCHGSRSRKYARTNIERVFSKKYRHPIYETSRYHQRGEDLPERSTSVPRHVACADCHVAHVSMPEVPWARSRGYSRGGLRLVEATNEYELCYLCHSDSTNLPAGSPNLRLELDPFNESYHPVEAAGRNRYVPSLVPSLNETSKITCSNCHGNNNPGGPRGPHGSDYEGLLVGRYQTEDGPESHRAYELCYICHERRSILGDESFKHHREHVVFQETSCHTCHASHGVPSNPHLISFDPDVVGPSSLDGGPNYMPSVKPLCYLSCHGVEHNSQGVGGKPW